MKLTDITKKFTTEDKCLDYLEQMRWPNGDLCCIRCGVLNVSKITREAGKNKRVRIYQCLEEGCRKQFSATSGTIFNDTHPPLTKWFMAIALICEAKKGHQRQWRRRPGLGQYSESLGQQPDSTNLRPSPALRGDNKASEK